MDPCFKSYLSYKFDQPDRNNNFSMECSTFSM